MRLFAFACVLLLPAGASAAGLIPGPGEAGHDAALLSKALAYDRQFHLFNAAPFGLSLDAIIPDPNDRSLVGMFLAQSASDDFAAFTQSLGTPRTIEGVIAVRDEHGDLGMFGGFGAMGEAFRYTVLRDSGAPTAQLDLARADLLEAIESFHVYTAITGQPGTIARGIRRTSEQGAITTEPLPASCPNAWDRSDTWRDDQSGQHAGWVLRDNTSKDQMLGYVLALGAFWDAIAEDASFSSAIKLRLQEDARLLAVSLMTPVEVRPGTSIDLVIRDSNDCLTRFHDINPREVVLGSSAPLVLAETAGNQNGFNALAALGIMRTLYHVSGDATVRGYYYNTLISTRAYPNLVVSGAGRVRNMFANSSVGGLVTNFSNVNMAWVAIYGLLRYETDPALRTSYEAMLASELWDGPRPHMGLAMQQAFFNLLWAGFRAGSTDDAQAASASAQLAKFVTPPYFDLAVENCDAGEIAAGTCIGVDGTTVINIDPVPACGGGVAAVDPLPKHIRPSSNFEWRSDPRVVNSTAGGDRLDPGGDFRGAYWLGRALQKSAAPGANISPIARNPDGSGGPVPPSPDAGVLDSGPDAGSGSSDAGAPDLGIDAGSVTNDASAPELDAGATLDAGSVLDAGTAAGDAGASGSDAAGAVDAAGMTGPADDSGCGCHATPIGHAGAGLLPLVAIALLSTRTRRRTRTCT